MNTARKNSRKGFTLVELLVVVLILAILMAVALPLYLSAVSDSQRKTCRANMQTIANAVQANYVKNMSSNYATYIGSVTTTAEPDLNAVPVCPNGGNYSITNGNTGSNSTFAVSCSYSGHGTFQPGVNSN
jgi:type IV pilus assembly protein PilA